jgi:2,3-bisphosphoglycerate-independent phosphoglycerate mutase
MKGAIEALEACDLVVAHVEAPDEAGHDGSVEDKVQAIERIDSEMVSVLRKLERKGVRVLVAPDHPTPIEVRTHVADPVPFLLWGAGMDGNGASGFTERQALSTGLALDEGHRIMAMFTS